MIVFVTLSGAITASHEAVEKRTGKDGKARKAAQEEVRAKGAIAMIAAKAHPEAEEVGRGKKGSFSEHFPMVAKDKLSAARLVLRFAPDLVDEVISYWVGNR